MCVLTEKRNVGKRYGPTNMGTKIYEVQLRIYSFCLLIAAGSETGEERGADGEHRIIV